MIREARCLDPRGCNPGKTNERVRHRERSKGLGLKSPETQLKVP